MWTDDCNSEMQSPKKNQHGLLLTLALFPEEDYLTIGSYVSERSSRYEARGKHENAKELLEA